MLCACLFLVGCSDLIEDVNMFHNVDPKIQVYYDRFTLQTGIPISNITAGFTPLSIYAGECVYNSVSHEIRIDPTYWSSIDSDDILKYQIVAHELGHCRLGLAHIPAVSYTIPDFQPLSIMNPYVFNVTQGAYLEDHILEYINALVSNKPIPQ